VRPRYEATRKGTHGPLEQPVEVGMGVVLAGPRARKGIIKLLAVGKRGHCWLRCASRLKGRS